jgi:hypothetical protein
MLLNLLFAAGMFRTCAAESVVLNSTVYIYLFSRFLVKWYNEIPAAYPCSPAGIAEWGRGQNRILFMLSYEFCSSGAKCCAGINEFKIACFFPEKGYNPTFFRLISQDKAS